MRTLEEIEEDVRHAMSISDVDALLRCVEELEALDSPRALAAAHMLRGSAFSHRGEYAEALVHFHRSLELNTELDNRLGVAAVTGNIGNVYVSTGLYPEALEQYHRALEMYTELGDRHGMARNTGNIGSVHMNRGSYPEALEHFHKALGMFTELGSSSNVAIFMGNIGNVHMATGDNREALEHYQQALELRSRLGDHSGVARVTANIITVLLRTEQYTEAEALLSELKMMQIDDPGIVISRDHLRASIKEHQGEIETAKAVLMAVLELAGQYNLVDRQASTHKHLRELALKQNDLQAYVHHNDEYTRITEELNGKDATQKMTAMEAQRSIEAERREREKERALLYGALPESVANRMLRGENVSGDHFENASVIFLDIVGFTSLSDKIPPGHVVHLLSQIFSALDDVCKKHGVTKIKTIGDSYMAVSGVPEAQADSAVHGASCALEMLSTLNTLAFTMPEELGDTSWTKQMDDVQVRIGLHCGPVTAGVIGTQRLQYDIWGDTVNVASRMESTGEPGRIQCSEAFVRSLTSFRDDATSRHPDGGEADEGPQANTEPWNYRTVERGTVEVKGKGQMQTYWLEQS